MRGSLHISLVLAAVMVLVFPCIVHAEEEQIETDNDMLRQGLQLFEELEYERAVEALSAALLQSDNSAEEQLLIFRTLGTLYVYLDRQQEAELALRRVLCVDADFDFGQYASPRIREVFDRVRQAWLEEGSPCEGGQQDQRDPAPARVSMDHESPHVAEPDEALDLTVTVEDPDSQVREVILFYRASGEQSFNQVPATSTTSGTFVSTIPGDAMQSPAAEYYLQATSEEGETLADLGTARAPLRVPVSDRTPSEGSSIVRRWWFWTIIGTVIVGTALGLGLGLGLREPDPPPIDQPDDEAILTITICDGETNLCFN